MDITVCTRIKQLLNEALLRGSTFITLDSLTEFENDELVECGFIVKRVKGKYIISQ